MATNSISILIQAKDSASDVLRQVTKSVSDLGPEAEKSAGKTGILGGAFDSFGRSLQYVGQAFIAYKLIDSIRDFGTTAFTTAGQLEQTNMSFQSLIGNTQEANKLFGELTQYANTTPFQSKDVTDAAKQLLAFGETASDTGKVVRQLGDVSAAGGGDLQALSLVTGQAFAQGKLRAQDMYQVINDGGAGLIKIMADNVGGMQNLTAEFDKGGIPASQYFDAINQATSKGGFAFEGANKQAETFNGKLSTLRDSAAQFGEALIGVHTDPELGLQIQPGGLFDRMKNGIQGISDTLIKWEPTVQKVIPEVLGNFKLIYEHIANFLGPTFKDLWKTISKDLMPALADLWHNILEPLAPYLAGAFLLAVKGIVTVFDDLLKIVSPVLQFMADHTWVVYGLAGAFGAMGAAMALGAAFDAIKVGVATLQLVTLPSLVASVGTMSSAWVAAFPIAGILADIALVAAAVNTVLSAFQTEQAMSAAVAKDQKDIDAVNKSMDQKLQSGQITLAQMYKFQQTTGVYTGPNKVYKQGNTYSTGFALGTNYAPGGMTSLAERGAELVVGPQTHNLAAGSQVIPAAQTAQLLRGGGGNKVHIENFNVNNNVDADVVIRKIGFRLLTA